MPRQLIDHPLAVDLVFDGVMKDVEPHQAGKKIMMLK